MRRNEPTDRDAFVALWIEETARGRMGRPVAPSAPMLPALPRHERLRDAVELMRRARAAERHALNLCNREVTARETARDIRNDAAIRALCAKYGFAVSIGGDPRGYVVKVKFPSGAHNTWGGAEEGWGVPA